MTSDVASRVFFLPRVGRHYGKSESLFAKKIFVLGDSHYCKFAESHRTTCGNSSMHPDCRSFTSECIDEYLDNGTSESWMKTYTTFFNSILGRATTGEDRRAIVESIVFYNYFQVAAGTNAYSACGFAAQYNDARHLDAFKAVLDETKPDIVISWGNRVWDALPNDWGFGEAKKGAALTIGGREFSSYQHYRFHDRRIVLIGVHHPCAGFASDFHHRVFKELGIV